MGYEDFTTIDWVDDARLENSKRLLRIQKYSTVREHNRFSFFKWNAQRILVSIQSWLVFALVGLVIGVIAGLINIVTEWMSNLKSGYCSNGFYLSENFCCWGLNHDEMEQCQDWVSWTPLAPVNYLFYTAISVAFAASSAYLVKYYAPYAAGSGISEIKCIIGGFVIDGFLSPRTLAIKVLAMPLSIAAGLSLGKEGPSVHYAACVGQSVASLFHRFRTSNTKMREVISACTAAGVAVAFGSPMGGVLFSIEEMAANFSMRTMWKTYFCAMIATTVLSFMNPFRTGQLVLFSVNYDRDWHVFEIPFFIILGIFGGLANVFFISANLWWQRFRKLHFAKWPIQEAAILALITSLVCYFNAFLRIDMTESMEVLFHECDNGWQEDAICDPHNRGWLMSSLLFAVIIRALLVLITYGLKVPAGIFVPSLAVGALFGRFVGTIVDSIHARHPDLSVFAVCHPDYPCITPGTYAYLGAAATLSGIMHITVTVVVIMFEITGAVHYILPTMIVVFVTKAISDRWGKGGVADRTIVVNGMPYLDSKEPHVFNADVDRAMCTDVFTVNDGDTVGQVRQTMADALSAGNPTGFPVLTAGCRLAGYILRKDLEYTVQNAVDGLECMFSTPISDHTKSLDAKEFVNFTPLAVRPTTPLESVTDIFINVGPRVILVTSDDNKFCGLITRKDILRYEHDLEVQHAPAGEQLENAIWSMLVVIGSTASFYLEPLVARTRAVFKKLLRRGQ